MKRWTLVLVAIGVMANLAIAATWSRTFSEPNKNTIAYSVGITNDGGFFASGNSFTSESDASSFDISLLKVNSAGDVQWQKTYGGNDRDIAYDTIKTSDGGFLIAGSTQSFGAGLNDIWLLKLDSSGNIQWQNTYGSNQFEEAYSIAETSDGGFIVSGTVDLGNKHFWILKLNSSGDVEWQRIYGDLDSNQFAPSILPTSDGGFILGGSTNIGNFETIIIKLASDGDVEWQKFYQPGTVSSKDHLFLQESTDGGYLILTQPLNNSFFGLGLMKINSSGDIQTFKIFKLGNFTFAGGFDQTSDGGYIIAGINNDFSPTVFTMLLKLDSSLNIEWQKSYDTTGNDEIRSLKQHSNGGFILAGTNQASGANFSNFWIMKLDSTGSIDPGCNFINDISTTIVTPTPTTGDIVAGMLGTFLDPQSTSITPSSQTINMVEQCSGGSACTFCDDFEDGVQPNWLITKPDFTETAGSYVGTPVGNKAETIASPVFSGCSVCSIEAVMRTGGGVFNKVWLLTFYIDKNNLIELLMKEESDRWVMKQRINKTVVAKAKGILTIDPNVDYDVTVSYDGTTVNVSVDGSALISMTPVGTPNGTVGFRVKKTVGSFNSILVN